MKKRRPAKNSSQPAKPLAKRPAVAKPKRSKNAKPPGTLAAKSRINNPPSHAAKARMAAAKDKDGPIDPADRAFSWYPGHMVKAKRELESNLKLADAVLLMLDARAPTATRHPELEEILAQRYTPFVLVLNKTDLAEESETERWRIHLKSQGFKVVEMSAVKGHGTGPLTPMLDQLEKEINEKRANKGLLPRNCRLMVAGLPNSGKSTLLNRLVGKGRFKVGKKPGLTRGAQWVTVAGRYQLLDTPGILYPRIEGEHILAILSAIGSVRRDVLPLAQVARRLMQDLHQRGRLVELLPKLQDVPVQHWTEQPLDCLADSWGFAGGGDEQARRAFDRFLNLFPEKPFRVTWQTAPA
jgi:ribosome biogenesis GTPase A